jgi:hypothetical protein
VRGAGPIFTRAAAAAYPPAAARLAES